ncbi:hypothetical protein ACKZDW_19760 [Ralstonia syzygii subsp. celebesensis]
MQEQPARADFHPHALAQRQGPVLADGVAQVHQADHRVGKGPLRHQHQLQRKTEQVRIRQRHAVRGREPAHGRVARDVRGVE